MGTSGSIVLLQDQGNVGKEGRKKYRKKQTKKWMERRKTDGRERRM
jgi:hypothetical protein